MKRMRVFKKMAVLIVLSVVLSAPSNVIYAFAEEYIDESESVDYEQSNLIENEESVENNQSDVKISEEVSSDRERTDRTVAGNRNPFDRTVAGTSAGTVANEAADSDLSGGDWCIGRLHCAVVGATSQRAETSSRADGCTDEVLVERTSGAVVRRTVSG